jgi:hypothetical protein
MLFQHKIKSNQILLEFLKEDFPQRKIINKIKIIKTKSFRKRAIGIV